MSLPAVGEFVSSAHACPVCEGHDLRIVSHVGRHYQALTTAICTGCGLVQNYPLPSDEELANYYRKQYRSDYKSAYTPKKKHILRYANAAMARMKRLRPFLSSSEIKLLDIGSGSGEFIYAAKLAGFDVTGIEPHEGYSNYTRETFDVPVLTANYQTAEVAEESVDVITLHHVLEHLRQPLEAILHMRRWLKPGGLIMIDVPDIEHTQHSPVNRFHYAHLYNFNHDTLKALLKKAGFEPVDAPANRQGTVLAARKTAMPAPQMAYVMTENYDRLWTLLMQGSEAAQYKQKRPVLRFLGKCWRYPQEILQACWIGAPRQIVRHKFQALMTLLVFLTAPFEFSGVSEGERKRHFLSQHIS